MARSNDPDFRALPAKVAQAVVKDVDEMYASFYALREKGMFARPPKFSPKGENGRFKVTFSNQAISSKAFKRGYIRPSGMDAEFLIPKYLKDDLKSVKDISEVRFVPKGICYQMEIVYSVYTAEYKDTGVYVGMDLGERNLIAMVSNVSTPVLIKSDVLRGINEYYIALKSDAQEKLPKGVKSSKNIRRLNEKRNDKIMNGLHCLTNQLIDYFKHLQVSDVFIGWNKLIKCGINIGRNNNRKFVLLPHRKLIDILKYKCSEIGIRVHVIKESYTSLCSFVDNEEICFHEEYAGKRMGRLFRAKDGRIINADVNGAYNILRKGMGIKFSELDSRKVFSTPRVRKIDYGYNTNRFHMESNVNRFHTAA